MKRLLWLVCACFAFAPAQLWAQKKNEARATARRRRSCAPVDGRRRGRLPGYKYRRCRTRFLSLFRRGRPKRENYSGTPGRYKLKFTSRGLAVSVPSAAICEGR